MFILAATVIALVSVAVLVAIFVTVSVAISAGATFRAVQHDSHVLETLFVIEALQFGQHVAFQQTCTYHKDGAVGQLFYDLRVGHNVNGWTVNKDVIILCTHLFNEFLETGFSQKFGRIGRNGTRR